MTLPPPIPPAGAPLPLSSEASVALNDLVVLPFTTRVLAEAQSIAHLRSSTGVSAEHILEATRKVRKGYVRSALVGEILIGIGWFLLGFFANLLTTFITMNSYDRAFNVTNLTIIMGVVVAFAGVLLIVAGTLWRSKVSE